MNAFYGGPRSDNVPHWDLQYNKAVLYKQLLYRHYPRWILFGFYQQIALVYNKDMVTICLNFEFRAFTKLSEKENVTLNQES